MRTATFILSFAIVGLASCSAPRTLIQSSRTDSVGIDRKVDIRTRIEYVPIIVHIPDKRDHRAVRHVAPRNGLRRF